MTESTQHATRWLAAARAGSREALGQLLEACRGYLLVIAQRELDPELRAKGGASDLLQETFLEAQRDFANFRGTTEAELLGWLRQMLLNNLATFSRRFRETRKRRLACEISLEDSGWSGALSGIEDKHAPAPPDQAMARERAELVRRALDRLPQDYRRVLLWRYQETQSFEEIGRLLQRSPNAARKLWARALERLQQELEPPP
jgi:RNA polymerase sigma-70 factor (ECF subfamily)